MSDETTQEGNPLPPEGDGIQVNPPQGGDQPSETPPEGFQPTTPPPAEQPPAATPPQAPPAAPAAPAQPERVKSPDDPVSIRCKSYTPGLGEKPVKELVMKLGGKKFIIPVGGVMQNVVPRRDAEKFIMRAKRYWTAQAELEISEPSFG